MEPRFPPPHDADHTTDAFSQWLLNAPTLGRWVALVDGNVAGHVLLTPAHNYLCEFFCAHEYRPNQKRGFAEVAKFFVDPEFQNMGVGDSLFRTACALSDDLLMQTALSVDAVSQKAVAFYANHGMRRVGSFDFYGVNHVFVHE